MVFWLIPLLLYGNINVGTCILLVIGGICMIPVNVWHTWCMRILWLRRLLLIVGCGGAACCLLLSCLIAHYAWFRPPPPDAGAPIVVLGCKVIGDAPSLMLRRRLDIAVTYLQDHPHAVCVVSGGQGADEIYPEAQVMHAYLVDAGIEADRILPENRSRNTQENIAFSVALLRTQGKAEEGQIVIATDSYHQLRAGIYASKEGVSTAHLSASTPWGLLPAYWVREFAGALWAWIYTG